MNSRLEYLTKRAFTIIAELYSMNEKDIEGHVKLIASNIVSRLKDYQAMCEGTSGSINNSSLTLFESQIAEAEDFLVKYRQHERSKLNGQKEVPILASKGISLDSLDGREVHEIFGGF